MNDATTAIRKASYLSGSQSALAGLLRVRPPTVNQWAKGVRPVPPKYCTAIETATSGAVMRQDLLPDDYWLIWPDLPAPAEQGAGTYPTRKA